MSFIQLHDYRQNTACLGLMVGLIWGGTHVVLGNFFRAAIIVGIAAIAYLVVSWLVRRERPSVRHRDALDAVGPDDLIIYWRPGCIYCDRLMFALRNVSDDLVWVDVSEDREAAAYVSSLNDGNVLVPTVVTPAGDVLAPDASAIRSRLRVA